MPPIFQSTRRSRRLRQSQTPESQQEQQTPFFGKSDGLSDVQGKSQPFFQAKLAIGQPGDPYEREADAVADAVVNHRGQAPVVQRQEISTVQRESLAAPQEEKEPVQMQTIGEEEEPVQMQAEEEEEPVQMQTMGEEEEPVQMQAEEEEEPVQMQTMGEEEEPVQMQTMGEEEEPVQMQAEEEEEPVQMKADSGNSGANQHLGNRLKGTAGKGEPLPMKTRAEMEHSFGVDFSQVNIHTDGEAVQLSKDLGAHAFTHGKDVYFNAGKYNPDNNSGKHLLAHELTHVVQQAGVNPLKIQRSIQIRDKESSEKKYNGFIPTKSFIDAFEQELKDGNYDSTNGISILKMMSDGLDEFKYENLEQLKMEIKYRLQTTSSMKGEISEIPGFGEWDTKATDFWIIKGGGFELRKIADSDINMNPSEAINALVNPANGLSVDCSTALAVLEILTVRKELGEKAFNDLYKTKSLSIFRLKTQQELGIKKSRDIDITQLLSTASKEQELINSLDQLIPGDRGYFKNYAMFKSDWDAEFVIYMGKENGEHYFRGHPFKEAKTYESMKAELTNAYGVWLNKHPGHPDERINKVEWDYKTIGDEVPGLYKIIERPDIVKLYQLGE